MGLDFDILEFCKKLRNSKQPPYHCPIVECAKPYKSMCGLQYHLVKYDHSAPPPVTPHPTPGRKKGRWSHHRPPPKTSDLLSSPTREGLTYAEAQKMVEFEFNGRATRVSISERLPLFSIEDFQAKYKNCVSQTAGQGIIEGRPPITEEKVRLPEPNFSVLDSYNIADAPPRPNAYIRFIERSAEELDVEVEYDMDEEDAAWLSLINQRRAASGVSPVPVDTFELLMDRLEKESYFQMQTCSQGGEAASVIDDDAVCCICMDGECQNSNVILFCDMCNLAVHQDCYGVPYIPEGQWLCRRCLQSPSRAVDCVLCPNNGGAFKQTDRGHWAHVVCALWIPEVRFANTVFLEPIDSIETIPPARWKLTCYICKQRGVGACIQCHKTNCYSAFHVTCAQQAGLFMKMDTVRDSHSGAAETGPVMVQKTAFCDNHTPPDSSPRPVPASKKDKLPETEDSRQKMKKARRILAKKRSSVPVISIPTIPPDRIQEIASLVTVQKKNQLIQRLIAYWTLKRQYRNGVPLLRRLQSSHLSRRDDSRTGNEVGPSIDELYRQLKYWQQLRQDLEKARLLCELVRKRERHKNELTKVSEHVLMGRLQPLACSLRRLLELIQLRDTGDIFSEPVDPTEVLDYSDVVKEPMDLSTMKTKIENYHYSNLEAFEDDFTLMIKNCMAYNAKDTIFYRAAVKLRDQGGALIRQARRDLDSSIDPTTGMLFGDGPVSPVVERAVPEKAAPSEENLSTEFDKELTSVLEKDEGMTSSERLAKLLELLDRCQELKPGNGRAKRIRLVKSEITKLRRKITQTVATSESDSEREESSDDEKTVRPTRQSKQPDRPVTPEIKRPRKKKVSEACASPPAALPALDSQAMEAETSLTVPVTPAKLVAANDITPLTVSPSGVNRRTAVLFTRKAQAAFRKSDPPPSPTPPLESSSGSSLSRRRVGRPRKNLDTTINQSAEGAVSSTNQSLGAESQEDSESLLMPAPALPCSESFRIYRIGGEIPAETDEETLSDSSCSSCSSTDGSTGSSEASSSLDLQHRGASAPESSAEEDGAAPGDSAQISLEPLDLVWAKCRGYPWYPALIIDPKMPRGFLHNGVPIPSPPLDVLALASNYTETVYLVLFFDTKRTWQWLPQTKLEPLGHSADVDQSKLTESRKPTDRKAVRKAFQEAQQHQVSVGTKRGRSNSTTTSEPPQVADN